MTDAMQRTVVLNPQEDNRSRAGYPPSGVVLDMAAAAAKIAVMKLMAGKSEGEIAGHEVVVTVKLRPIGEAVDTCEHKWTDQSSSGEFCYDCGRVKR